MEFPFGLRDLFREDITRWDETSMETLRRTAPTRFQNLLHVIDELGAASAKAQRLPVPITGGYKLLSSGHVAYIAVNGPQVLGLLKIGVKNLFIRNEHGAFNEITPMCVLDFYVEESFQRKGIGKLLFEYMLEVESQKPHMMGYDRPSPKFIGFLRKHYGLVKFVPQSNNFVVFNAYFESPEKDFPRSPFSRTSIHKSVPSPSVSRCLVGSTEDRREESRGVDEEKKKKMSRKEAVRRPPSSPSSREPHEKDRPPLSQDVHRSLTESFDEEVSLGTKGIEKRPHRPGRAGGGLVVPDHDDSVVVSRSQLETIHQHTRTMRRSPISSRPSPLNPLADPTAMRRAIEEDTSSPSPFSRARIIADYNRGKGTPSDAGSTPSRRFIRTPVADRRPF
eukprot:TRINITY_DN643_c0_g1_i1.p1 TRINITY_DN643_c0_g1~~TRINITY_DN643_c0_g1_i1.p1  ORF type:complete len:392 (-),score=69.96 TRINITY_DN643_c0_g1_i1:1283-2458(-)